VLGTPPVEPRFRGPSRSNPGLHKPARGTPMTGVRVVNNRIGKWDYGPALICRQDVAEWSQNIQDGTATTISKPAVIWSQGGSCDA